MKWESAKQETTEWKSGEWRKWIFDCEGQLYIGIQNIQLIIPPQGSGVNEKQAFANILDEISEYRLKLDKIEAEIRQILSENNNEDGMKNVWSGLRKRKI